MLYLHDVWVNWFEGEENGYNVCHFHEWRKEDKVELLDQVPLLKVEPVLFDYIENDLLELPSSLLKEVHKNTYIRKNHERIQVEYCFIVTDGTGILAVDTLGYQIPIKKSRLIPRHEQLVYEMIAEVEAKKYTFSGKKDHDHKEHHILSVSPEYMTGLTRKERQLKQLLFMALDQLYSMSNVAEIRYWYTEWSPHDYKMIQEMTFEEVWNHFYDEAKQGWSQKHEQICQKLVKGQPFFEKLWEFEQESRVN